MHQGDYPTSIRGFHFLQRRELPPVSTCWDFQVTESLSPDSARRLLAELPEDYQLDFFDPEPRVQEESWLLVRRVGQRYFVKRVDRGSLPWEEHPLERVLALFAASPLVQKPKDPFTSFTVSSIPDHQRHDHINGRA